MSVHVLGFYVFGALASQLLQQSRVKPFRAQSYSWEEESIAPSRGCENQAGREVHLSAAMS